MRPKPHLILRAKSPSCELSPVLVDPIARGRSTGSSMPPSQLRNVGKFISAASISVTLVFLPSSTGFSSVVPSPRAPAVAAQPAQHAPLILANPTAPTAQESAIETPPE